MKKVYITSLFFFILSLSSFSQNWLTNFNEAKKEASEKNKIIVLVFQGSDWCAPCIKELPYFEELNKTLAGIQQEFKDKQTEKEKYLEEIEQGKRNYLFDKNGKFINHKITNANNAYKQ